MHGDRRKDTELVTEIYIFSCANDAHFVCIDKKFCDNSKFKRIQRFFIEDVATFATFDAFGFGLLCCIFLQSGM